MALNNSLTQSNSKQKLSTLIQTPGYRNMIDTALSDQQRATRFIANTMAAYSQNPSLQECEPSTIISCALAAETLNLSVQNGIGQAYLIPYKDRKNNRTVCTFQIGINGWKQLALRSGQFSDIDVIEVREGEYKGRDKSNGKPTFEFYDDDDIREMKPIVGYLAYFEMLNGFKKSLYWTANKVLNHADKYSQAFSMATYEKIQSGEIPQTEMWKYQSPWYSSFDSQACKTVLKNLLSKWAVVSVDLQSAIRADQSVPTIKDGILDGVEYVDRPNDEIAMEAPENPVQTLSEGESDPLS